MTKTLALFPLALLVAACGGGGSEAGSTAPVTDGTAQAMSANSTVMPEDGTASAETLVKTTQAVVAAGSASQTIACAGGGTAVFTVTGGSLASVTNGQFDAGEVYAVTYTACRGSAGVAALDGSATLTVVAASAGSVQVDTATRGITVTLPQRVLTLDGSSSITQTVSTSGSATTVTTRWTSPQIAVTSRRNARNSSFTLSGVDLTRSITTTNGVVTARSSSGTHTLDAVLPNASWSVTVATQGSVSFDANGVPTQGAWTVTLPANRIGVAVVPGTATITVDHGPDGTVDRTIVITTGTLDADAG